MSCNTTLVTIGVDWPDLSESYTKRAAGCGYLLLNHDSWQHSLLKSWSEKLKDFSNEPAARVPSDSDIINGHWVRQCNREIRTIQSMNFPNYSSAKCPSWLSPVCSSNSANSSGSLMWDCVHSRASQSSCRRQLEAWILRKQISAWSWQWHLEALDLTLRT